MNRFLVAVGVIALLVITLAWYFSSIFSYVIISLILASLLRPVVDLATSIEFAGMSVPRGFVILFSYGLLVVVATAFVLLFVPLISDQITLISSLKYQQVVDTLLQPIQGFESYLISAQLTEQPPGFIVDGIQAVLIDFVTGIDVAAIFNQVLSLTGSVFIGFMAVAFITFFLLYEEGIIRKNICLLIPNKYFELFINALHKIERLLSNYLLGLLLQMITIFTLVALGLSVVGVKYALTIALFAAVANLIPYLGPLLGGAFGLLVALSTQAMTWNNQTIFFVLQILLVFSVVQVTDNVLLQPLIFSKSVKAHPLEIFVIIFVGATIAGILGMIAAIPVYTIVRVFVVEFYSGLSSYRVFKKL